MGMPMRKMELVAARSMMRSSISMSGASYSTLCALAIGGLDPGGGAGILADARAFRAAGVVGCAAVAVLPVQSTDGLVASVPVSPLVLIRQACEVVRAQNVRAIKVG